MCSRWSSLIAGLFILLCSGTVYLFGVYREQFLHHLQMSATQLSIVSTFAQSAHYISAVPWGMAADRYSAVILCIIAAFFQGFGYVFMAFTYKKQVPDEVATPLLTLFFTLVGLGSSGAYAAALTTNVKNFSEESRGKVVGAHVAMFGLSALVFTQINNFFFLTDEGQETFQYLLCIGVVIFTVTFIGSLFIRNYQYTTKIYQQFLVNEKDVDEKEEEDEDQERSAQGLDPLLGEQVFLDQVNISGWDLFKQTDFWMLSFILGLGVACGLMYVNNVSSIVSSITYSLGYSEGEIQEIINLHVSLISLMNCTGRIFIGILSDLILDKCNLKRYYFLLISVTCLFLSQVFLIFVDDLTMLIFASIFVGASYGFVFSITPTIVGDVFGMRSYGANWGWVVLSPSIGGPITNLLFGFVYDNNSREENGRTVCDGAECYRASFFFTTLVSGLVLFVTILFCFKRKKDERAKNL